MTATLLSAIGTLPGWNISLFLLLAKATIILIAALGITLSMQRASAGARHLVWLVTLGTLLLVPALTAWAPLRLAILPAPAVDAPKNAAAIPSQGTSVQTEQPSPITNEASRVVPPTRDAAPSSMMSRLLSSISAMSAVSLVVAIWAAVVLGIAASLAWAAFTVRRIVRRARPLDTPDWATPLFEIADRLGLEEAPRLLQSSDAKMPFACGVLQPTIVLPAESESWTLERRRAVLLHELAHVRRHDLLGHTLGRLVCAVYWFHPLVWTAAKHLRSESERACDDLALSCGTRATDYAEHLLDIVTSVRGEATPLVALAMARRKEFEGRMLAILDPELRRSTPSRTQSAAMIAALALISITVGAAAPVQREARAATLPAAQEPRAVPKPVAEARPLAAPMRMNAYPDSGVRGDKRISTTFSQSETVSQSVSQSPTTPQNTVQTPTQIVDQQTVNALANAGVKIGMSAATAALNGVLQGLSAPNGKKSDDRPILLAKVLRSDTSATLRRIAAWGLQEYADSPIAAEALANAVRRDADAKVREMAAWALGNGNGENAGVVDALVSTLKSDSNERVRAIAAWALGNIDDKSSVDGLAAALSDASESVRIRAAWALGNVGPRQAPKALVALLSDKEPRVRHMAAWALFNIEDVSTVPALETALKNEQDKELQLSYIRALAAMGDKSVDAIRGLLESPDQRIKAMAVRALAGGHAAGPWPMPMPEPRPFP